MIRREHYLSKIRGFYDSDLIKIITGVRRCGKSVILEQIKSEISKNTDKIIYLNFEDRRIYSKIKNADDLIKYVDDIVKDNPYYLFFDEIQNLENWAIACKTLRLKHSVFITGSNSQLLSNEFTKELSGRYVSFKIQPFVYKEILQYTKELNIECSISDYLIWGGFPKRFEFNFENQIEYLNSLNETIIYNDLINRFKIRKTEIFKSVIDYILKSNSRICSINSITNYIKSEHTHCSINTIMKYISYLEEAYIIDSIKLYSKKVKKELSYYKKIYNEDVSFNSIRCIDNKYDITHNLENIVYNELKYMGYSIFMYDNNGKEIDFLAQKNNLKYYIQVAYSVVEEKAYAREFDAFKNIDNNVQKIIITNDDIDYSTSTIKHIKLKDFLLMNDLES